jgi:general secretion pathway protein K
MKTEKGIALMMVLWVLVLLSMIAMNFSFSTRWNSASTRNLKEETIAYYMCISGYQEAVNYLLSDKDPSVDFIDNEGNFWIDGETTPVTGKKMTEEGDIDIMITDEGSKVNINLAGEERLRKLLDYIGIPPDSEQEVIDSILDWIDPDKEHRLSGAEDEYYEGLDFPYKAKNSFFDTPEELLLVKGMEPDYMAGSDKVKAISPLITTFGKGTININTVSKEVMELLGLNPLDIETILKQRNKESGGFRFIPTQLSNFGLNTTSSSYFRIEVISHLKGSNRAMRIVAILHRMPAPKGFKTQTVYWRENAETYRG